MIPDANVPARGTNLRNALTTNATSYPAILNVEDEEGVFTGLAPLTPLGAYRLPNRQQMRLTAASP